MITGIPRVASAAAVAVAVGLILNGCGGDTAAPKACTVASLAIAPATATVLVGQTTQLGASISSSDCSTQPVATWTSSAPTVATVSATGEVEGVAAGTAVVTATAAGLSGTAAVTVNGAPTLSVAHVTPSAGSTGVTIDSVVRLVFSAALDRATVTSSTVLVKLGAAAIAGALTVNDDTVTFKPAVPLTEFRSVYSVTVTTGLKSTVGNFLAAPFTTSFATVFADSSYFYQITNAFIGQTKALDTYSGDTHPAFLSAPLATYTGQFWYFVPNVYDTRYTYLKNMFLGDTWALEGGTSGETSLMTGLAPAGHYFTGQAWTFTPVGAPYADGYRLTNQNAPASSLDVPVFDASQVGLRPTASVASQVWYFKRMQHR